jgi:hypothetical protein
MGVGCFMKRFPLSFGLSILLVLAVLSLNSCSGLNGGGITPPPGNGTLVLVLKANPPLPSSNLSLLSFSGTVTGVSLTPSTGTTSTLAATTFNVEFTRLTSDTFFLGTITAPAGAYTAIAITFGAHTATFCTQPTVGVAGCGTAATQVSGGAGSATVTTSINIVANQNSSLALVANLGNAITATGQTITAVNLGAANVFSASAIPGTSDLTSSQLAHLEDIFGVVTSVSSSTHTIGVQTATHGSITAVQGSNAIYDSNGCTVQDFTCVVAGKVVSLDAVLNSDGTFTYTYFDPTVLATANDLVEGIVTVQGDSITRQFSVVTTDFSPAASGSLVSGLNLGDPIVVTLSATPSPFSIDSKGLFVPANTFNNGTDASVIQPGQTVLIHVTAFTAKNGTTPAAISSDALALRYTRVSGTVATAGSPIFSVNALPPFFGISGNAQMQVSSTLTSLDGYAPPLTVSAGDDISARALYFGPGLSPSFSAGTVRKQP